MFLCIGIFILKKKEIKYYMIRLKSLLIEQEQNLYFAKLDKIDQSISDLINNGIVNGTTQETTILGVNGKIIRWVPSTEPAKGTFHIFDVVPAGGIPYIREMGGAMYRGNRSTPDDIKVGSQAYASGNVPSVESYGKTTLEQLNNIWSAKGNKTEQVLDVARQFVDRNREVFIKEFKRVTRNEWAIKTLWNENPQPKAKLAGSQYYAFFVNKLNPLPKDIVETIIQDIDLRDHLNFKVNNYSSSGKYPNITPPVPQPVIPGSGYPIA